MLRILGTIFAALLGLCFGSFLNVCLSRWPTGESIVHPRSHCRDCARTLAWWENLPVVSWIALRGRCRTCSTWISIRYPLVEAAVAALWAIAVNQGLWVWVAVPRSDLPPFAYEQTVLALVSHIALLWLLVALAVLDAENLWLPDFVTWPGIVVGIALSALVEQFANHFDRPTRPIHALLISVASAAIAAAIILLIRWIYWLIRRREGLGLGDAKLMAMLAAWLGLPGSLLSLFLGVVLGALFAVTTLAARRREGSWAAAQLPLGTFLCIGGIVSALWGRQIIESYLRLFP